jgi:hypothetical protein
MIFCTMSITESESKPQLLSFLFCHYRGLTLSYISLFSLLKPIHLKSFFSTLPIVSDPFFPGQNPPHSISLPRPSTLLSLSLSLQRMKASPFSFYDIFISISLFFVSFLGFFLPGKRYRGALFLSSRSSDQSHIRHRYCWASTSSCTIRPEPPPLFPHLPFSLLADSQTKHNPWRTDACYSCPTSSTQIWTLQHKPCLFGTLVRRGSDPHVLGPTRMQTRLQIHFLLSHLTLIFSPTQTDPLWWTQDATAPLDLAELIPVKLNNTPTTLLPWTETGNTLPLPLRPCRSSVMLRAEPLCWFVPLVMSFTVMLFWVGLVVLRGCLARFRAALCLPLMFAKWFLLSVLVKLVLIWPYVLRMLFKPLINLLKWSTLAKSLLVNKALALPWLESSPVTKLWLLAYVEKFSNYNYDLLVGLIP